MYDWNHKMEPYKPPPTVITMASSCKKVNNPCKICLGNVTHKSGIQCEGACRSWVHYKCLNFTPGKISDIKRGLIIVSCPCPDCKTDMPKEIVKDEPFSCTNAYCPANIPPKCMNAQCPSNAALPPPGHNNLLAAPQQLRPMPHYGPCTIDTCKSTKVSPTHRQFKFRSNKNKSSSPCVSCCSGGDLRKSECVTQTKPLCPPMHCLPMPLPPPPRPPPQCPPPPCPPPPCPPPQCLPPQCPPPQCPPPPCPPPQCPMPKCAPPPRPPRNRASSPKWRYINSQAAKKNTAAIKAMERMCTTMGQLTCQLNTLMDKMQLALTMPQCPSPTTCVMPSTQTDSCSLTELPCCCPGGGQQGGNEKQSMGSCPPTPPCCTQDQQDSNYDSQPCYCPSNPLRRTDYC